jgi:hypothetical protein
MKRLILWDKVIHVVLRNAEGATVTTFDLLKQP